MEALLPGPKQAVGVSSQTRCPTDGLVGEQMGKGPSVSPSLGVPAHKYPTCWHQEIAVVNVPKHS